MKETLSVSGLESDGDLNKVTDGDGCSQGAFAEQASEIPPLSQLHYKVGRFMSRVLIQDLHDKGADQTRVISYHHLQSTKDGLVLIAREEIKEPIQGLDRHWTIDAELSPSPDTPQASTAHRLKLKVALIQTLPLSWDLLQLQLLKAIPKVVISILDETCQSALIPIHDLLTGTGQRENISSALIAQETILFKELYVFWEFKA